MQTIFGTNPNCCSHHPAALRKDRSWVVHDERAYDEVEVPKEEDAKCEIVPERKTIRDCGTELVGSTVPA